MSTQALQKSQQAKLQLEEALLRGMGARGEMMKRVGGSVFHCTLRKILGFVCTTSTISKNTEHLDFQTYQCFKNVWSASHGKNQFEVMESMPGHSQCSRDSQAFFTTDMWYFKYEYTVEVLDEEKVKFNHCKNIAYTVLSLICISSLVQKSSNLHLGPFLNNYNVNLFIGWIGFHVYSLVHALSM